MDGAERYLKGRPVTGGGASCLGALGAGVRQETSQKTEDSYVGISSGP